MMKNHPHIQNWDDNRICLGREDDDDGEWVAYCSPEATGGVFVDSDVSVGSSSIKQISHSVEKHGAPFPIDIIFNKRHPHQGEVSELNEELGEHFATEFDSKVDDTIMDLDGEFVGE